MCYLLYNLPKLSWPANLFKTFFLLSSKIVCAVYRLSFNRFWKKPNCIIEFNHYLILSIIFKVEQILQLISIDAVLRFKLAKELNKLFYFYRIMNGLKPSAQKVV